MEGRDIGTKVFPKADVKIFLDADPEVRGSRRFKQNPAVATEAHAVTKEMRERDERDRTRASSPLEAAEDAIKIDSTHLSLDEVIAEADRIIAQRLAARSGK